MLFNEVCVLLVLAACCFIANVLHGLTGCGSILALQALWQTAVTIAPDVMHSTEAFNAGNVKSIAEFSYVLTFFIQLVLTGLLFFDERRKRAQQREHGLPPAPSELNGVLLLAFIPCSFAGAAVGLYTMPHIHENGARIILGGSSLFFALTFLSLYQMKYLEKKKTEDVIRDDLMLMRIQSEVQRHVILQYMEDQRRRKARKERRRRHRAQRRLARKAEKAHRREVRLKALTAKGSSTSPLVVVPVGEGRDENDASVAELEGAPLEPNVAATIPHHAQQQRTGSLSDVHGLARLHRPLEVHGSSQGVASHGQMMGDVHLPDSVIGDSDDRDDHPGTPRRRRHHLQRFWIKGVDVQTFVRQRLAEISRHVDSANEEVAREATLAAWTLQAMEGHDSKSTALTPAASPTEGDGNSASRSSSSNDGSDTEADESTVTSTTLSTGHHSHTSTSSSSSAKGRGKASHRSSGSESGEAHDAHARTVRFDSTADPAIDLGEREELHTKWKLLHGKSEKDGGESIDLSRSIARAAATAPRRVILGHSELLNIGLREAQQQQLKNLQELNANEHRRDGHRHRLVHFIRMDGGVVVSAMVSSFFSGLLGSYTGVAHPPLTIFALAMDISVPELRIHYAVSSVVPAGLRAVIGIVDGFANKSVFVYYLVAVLFAWGGVAFGLHISHRNAVSQATFMVAILTTLLLVAFLMVVPVHETITRVAATVVCLVIVVGAIFRQQKKPEHRRPPAPPNTPATVAEVEAFELYWRQHSRRQRAIVEYENEGSVVSMRSSTSTTRTPSSASVPPTPGTRRRQHLQHPHDSRVARRSTLEAEDVPVRSREDAEEELITIVPVKAH